MKSKAAQALTQFPAESQSAAPLRDVLCLGLTSQRPATAKHILRLQGRAAELHPGSHY